MTFLECGGGWECNEVVSCPLVLVRATPSDPEIQVSMWASIASIVGHRHIQPLLLWDTDLQMCSLLDSVWVHLPKLPSQNL